MKIMSRRSYKTPKTSNSGKSESFLISNYFKWRKKVSNQKAQIGNLSTSDSLFNIILKITLLMIGKDDKMGFIFCYLDVNNLSGMEFFNIYLGS